jgi:hypothetical protein
MVEMTAKRDMEKAIMEENEKKFLQAIHTPFMQQPLLRDFGYLGIGPHADEVMQGEYPTPPGVDQYTRAFIEHLAMEPPIQQAAPIRTYFTTEDGNKAGGSQRNEPLPAPTFSTSATSKRDAQMTLLQILRQPWQTYLSLVATPRNAGEEQWTACFLSRLATSKLTNSEPSFYSIRRRIKTLNSWVAPSWHMRKHITSLRRSSTGVGNRRRQ